MVPTTQGPTVILAIAGLKFLQHINPHLQDALEHGTCKIVGRMICESDVEDGSEHLASSVCQRTRIIKHPKRPLPKMERLRTCLNNEAYLLHVLDT